MAARTWVRPASDLACVHSGVPDGDLRVELLLGRAHRLGGAHRSGAELPGALHLVDAEHGRRELSQHLRARATREARREQSYGLLEHRDAFVVTTELPQDRRPPREQQGALLQRAAVADLLQRLVDERQRPVDRTRPPRRVSGGVEQFGVLDSRALLGAGHLAPQLQGELVVALGRRWRVRVDSGPAGPHRRRQRARQVVGGEPVVGEHRDRVQPRVLKLGIALDGLGVEAVKLCALARQQVIVDRRPRERVTEAVAAAGRIDDEQLVLDCLAKRRIQLLIRQPRHDHQQSLRYPPAAAGHNPQDALGIRGQPLGAREQDIP